MALSKNGRFKPRSVGARPNSGIRGMDIVLNNLNKEILKIRGKSMKGLITAAAYIRSDMDKTEPLIPVDTGNLRSSYYTSPANNLTGKVIGLKMGFSANSALYVHERFEGGKWGAGVVGHINWSREGSGPKFFEAALKRNRKIIVEIIKQSAKIKK